MVARERNDAGDETAYGFAVGAPRPAHDPDQRTVPLVEHRPAGVAAADAEAGGFAEFLGIDQAELLRAWAIGRDQRDRAQLARGLAVTLHSHTEARDDEPVADPRPRPPSAEWSRREIRRWWCKLDERQVGSIGARRELRMGSDACDVLDHGSAAFERQQSIFAVAQHAVCGRKHEIGRDRHAGA